MPRNSLLEQAASIYRKYQSGGVVMRQLGLPRTTAYRLLKEAGITLPGRNSREVYDRKRKLQGIEAQHAAEDYATGMPLSKMRKKYGVGTHAIRTAAQTQGVNYRPRGGQSRKLTDEQIAKIIWLYSHEKLSQEHIASMFHCGQTHVSRIILSSGVTRHKDNFCGRSRHGDGYILLWLSPDDPMASMRNRAGYVLEHRLVMARRLGRVLSTKETVHHIDGNRENNKIENLQLRHARHGNGAAFRCADCGSTNIVEYGLTES